MSKIKGWEKIGDLLYLKRYYHIKTGRILEVVKDGYTKNSIWKIQTLKNMGGKVTRLHTSKNLKNALEFAHNYMKRHSNG